MQENSSESAYLTTDELAQLIKYDARTIRNRLKDSVLLEGVHYIRPFGRRKILFIRAAIERDIGLYSLGAPPEPPATADAHGTPTRTTPPRRHGTPRGAAGIPMATGGVCNV